MSLHAWSIHYRKIDATRLSREDNSFVVFTRLMSDEREAIKAAREGHSAEWWDDHLLTDVQYLGRVVMTPAQQEALTAKEQAQTPKIDESVLLNEKNELIESAAVFDTEPILLISRIVEAARGHQHESRIRQLMSKLYGQVEALNQLFAADQKDQKF